MSELAVKVFLPVNIENIEHSLSLSVVTIIRSFIVIVYVTHVHVYISYYVSIFV